MGIAVYVDGAVKRPGWIDEGHFAACQATGLTSDFVCLEGWRIPRVTWSGVRLRDLLRPFRPKAEARWVQIVSGDFAACLDFKHAAAQGLLATKRDGTPLHSRQGPVRFVLPGADCTRQVKAVDRIVLTCRPMEDTAAAIALARLRRHEGNGTADASHL